MSSTGSTASQLTLDEFVPRVQTDDDGNPIPPATCAGYVRSVEESTEVAVWAAPSRVGRGHLDLEKVRKQRRVYVIVDSETGSDQLKVFVVEDSRKPFSPSTYVETADDPVEAVEVALDWMEEHPAPENPEYPNGKVDPERVMYYRDRDNQAECIREGSTVAIDNYLTGTIVGQRKDQEEEETSNSPGRSTAAWICQLPSGDQFDIVVDTSAIRGNVGYSQPGTTAEETEALIEPQYVDVSNENNLRDDVHTETYEWLKEREGETVIYDGDGETIEVQEIETVRDGALNPSSGAVDPDDRRTTYISQEHAGEWYPCPFDLESGSYRVIEEGLVSSDDKFGATIHVPADEWESYTLPTPENPESRTNVDVDIAFPDDRPGLSDSDHITEIIGIGEKTAEQVWKDTVGELYHNGWPLPFVSSQYQARAIADMYTVAEDCGEDPGVLQADAIRAVVGMLGGVAYGSDGERLGCTANTITGELDMQEAQTGWLTHDNAIKKEYCPNWSIKGKGDDGVVTFAAGDISRDDICRAIVEDPGTASEMEPDDIDHVAATQILEPVGVDRDTVAISGQDDSYVEAPKRPVEIAASIALCDIDDPETLNEQVRYWPAGDSKGVLLFDNPEVEWTAVVDTNGWVTPERTIQAQN